MKAIAFALLSSLLLAACGKSATVREAVGGGFVQLAGAELVLKQPVTVPAGKARVFIQDGGRADGRGGILSGGFNHYRAHCALEISRVDHAGFTIRPDTFRITQVQGSLEQVVMNEPLQVAGLRRVSDLDGGGSSAYHEGYHFWLSSERQPEVRRMSCYGIYAEPSTLQPPTLEEIRGALGDVAEIRR